MSIQLTEIKELFPNLPVARYNIAAWQKPSEEEESVVLIGREVARAGGKGEPDKGKLVLFEMDIEGNIVHERVIWEPKHTTLYLEDPRALLLPNGDILIGLSALLKNAKNLWEPFPAVVKIDSNEPWREELPPVTLIETFGPGKNLTPLDSHTFLFRPEEKQYYHKLLVFSFRKLIPEKVQDIPLPTNLPWAKWRMGTTMPPLWLNENEALFIVHGINIVGGKYIYSIGRAKFSRKNDKYSVKVAPEPILTPDTFAQIDDISVRELHNNRRVVYACGGIVKKNKQDILFLYVNVGDSTTVEVGLPMDELKKGLF